MSTRQWTQADWAAWTVAIYRPARLDDEEVSPGLVLMQWWHVRDILGAKYGANNVQRRTVPDGEFTAHDIIVGNEVPQQRRL